MKRSLLLCVLAGTLAACATTSVDSIRSMPVKETFTTAKTPEATAECVVAAFNGNARGFEWIQFDGAKSWKQGDRYVISADTTTPMYVLDVIPAGTGSIVEERSTLAGAIGPRYQARFRELISSCL